MFITHTVHLLLAFGASLTLAAPAANLIETRSGVTSVSSSTVTALSIYAQFSRAAYCAPSKISGWTCGQACSALPGFVPYLTGGDGASTPYYFVGYWPTENTAVVVHQGTDPIQLESDLTDVQILFTTLDNTLFPGLSSSIEVHSGFASAQASGATAILAAVSRVLSDHSITKVTLVGHSLGAAISTIEMIYLKLNLPSSTSFKFVGHGSPRVGNQAFANYFDATFSDVTRINHAEDLIPIVPGRSLGYHHVSGEVHILDSNAWVACAGQDNTDTQCSTGDVPTIFNGNIIDHLGPYNGIWIGTTYCT